MCLETGMKTLPDWQIENQLAIIHSEMINSMDITDDRMKQLVERQKELIAMRSPEHIRNMEIAKGLV